MKQWYAKELSNLTQVSVRTLHHYDKIGLLKPNLRQSNNYRLYSEKDLLQLQQIIALKFFGFGLSQIKTLLANQVNVLENFAMQAQFLHEKGEALIEAGNILKHLTSNCSHDESISWEKMIQIIEVYHMTQQLENTWVKEIFNAEELKQYAKFEADLKLTLTEEEIANRQKNWSCLMKEITYHLQDDPTSEVGARLGKKFMDVTNHIFGKKNANLRTKMYEMGFGEGLGLQDYDLTPDIVTWLEPAIEAYFRQRLSEVFAKIGKNTTDQLLELWKQIMDEMYGEDEERKITALHTIMLDDELTCEAKKWLKSVFNL